MDNAGESGDPVDIGDEHSDAQDSSCSTSSSSPEKHGNVNNAWEYNQDGFHTMKRLGFLEYEDEELRQLEIQWHKKSTVKLNEASKAWSHFFMNKGGYEVTLRKVGKKMKKIVRRHAIPARHRPKVWFEISGANLKMESNKGYYKSILDSHVDQQSRAVAQIELDLSRTFPDHPYFNTEESEGRQRMRRILVAYSWRNTYVSYCQSLNYIVGLLLLHFDEEKAFWMLVIIIEEILPPDFYGPQLKGLRTDNRVLDELMKSRLPQLERHFRNNSVDTTTFISGWLMRLFVDIFPIETTMRIWDCMFNEGSKILFRAALAYLKQYEVQLMQQKHVGEVLHFLNKETVKMFDHAQLTKTMWSFHNLRRGTVRKLRKRLMLVIDEEEKEIERQREAYTKSLSLSMRQKLQLSSTPPPGNSEQDVKDSPTVEDLEQSKDNNTKDNEPVHSTCNGIALERDATKGSCGDIDEECDRKCDGEHDKEYVEHHKEKHVKENNEQHEEQSIDEQHNEEHEKQHNEESPYSYFSPS